MGKRSPIAKISRPHVQNVLLRPRLFRLLDAAAGKSASWISGPAGSGKTTLVASWLEARNRPSLWYRLDEGDGDLSTFFYYLGLAAEKGATRSKKPLPLLTPEYLTSLPVFTRRFFEQLCSRLTSRSRHRTSHGPTLVFDNHHDVPEESLFHAMIPHGLASVPSGGHVIFISRSAPPASLSDLLAKRSMELIEWETVRFTRAEANAMLKSQGKKLTPGAFRDVYERTRGWAAGLVLMGSASGTAPVAPSPEFSRETIFNYFAGEIVSRLDRGTRSFLIKSCLLPAMTADTAKKLTGNAHAGRILSRLNRDNFFTEKHAGPETVYSYHPLFREFLLSRVQEELGKETLSKLRKQAAAILHQAGRTEDAADLFMQARDWHGLAGVILRQAPLLMAQGRSGPVEAWLSAIPDDFVEGSPWLLYWKGMSRFISNPAESLAHLEKAFHRFRTRKDVPGVFLAWAGIVDSVFYSFGAMDRLDAWIEKYDRLLRGRAASLPPAAASRVAASLFLALVYRRPWCTDLDPLLERAAANPGLSIKIPALMHSIHHRLLAGGLKKGLQALDELHRLTSSPDAAPFHRLTVSVVDIICYNLTGRYELSRKAALEGLSLAAESGVHLFDVMLAGTGIIAAYDYGDYDAAKSLSAGMPSEPLALRPYDRVLVFHIRIVDAIHEGDFRKALRISEQALIPARQCNDPISPFEIGMLHAQVLYELGKRAQARRFLDRISEPWRREARSYHGFLYHMTNAWFSLDGDDPAPAHESLRRAMSIGREEGLITAHPLRRETADRLFCAALERGIETEYARDVVRRRNIVPEEPPVHIENWPWRIRIYTLGRFEVRKDDRPLTFAGKVQKKPLEMLKALVSFGGSGVAEDRIMDALWPDADGDTARSSFKTTLHRLRQLLGKDEFLQLHDGRLSLDPRACWTDAAAFERMLERSRSGLQGPETVRLDKALELYRGHFLPHDEDKPWTVSLREQLKRKFILAVAALGEGEEDRRAWKKAIAVYERGLEVDDLSEEFYQRLMFCYRAIGRRADAVRMYERCRKVLAASLGIGPSPETEALYRRIVR
jgi:LuxR family maltose regulon positive regulatory protein